MPEDPELHRALLEEFAVLNPEIRIADLTATSADAREILRRLEHVGYPALSDEDEAALASLVDNAEAANHVESEQSSVP